VLAERDTWEYEANGFYPFAKNYLRGSGSNKFCLAVLAWAKGALRRDRGRRVRKLRTG
jgi:hypothetical protein